MYLRERKPSPYLTEIYVIDITGKYLAVEVKHSGHLQELADDVLILLPSKLYSIPIGYTTKAKSHMGVAAERLLLIKR